MPSVRVRYVYILCYMCTYTLKVLRWACGRARLVHVTAATSPDIFTPSAACRQPQFEIKTELSKIIVQRTRDNIIVYFL